MRETARRTFHPPCPQEDPQRGSRNQADVAEVASYALDLIRREPQPCTKAALRSRVAEAFRPDFATKRAAKRWGRRFDNNLTWAIVLLVQTGEISLDPSSDDPLRYLATMWVDPADATARRRAEYEAHRRWWLFWLEGDW